MNQVRVHRDGRNLTVENGGVQLRLVWDRDHYDEVICRRGADGAWLELLRSAEPDIQPDQVISPKWTEAALLEESGEVAVVELKGGGGGLRHSARLRLEAGRPYVHADVDFTAVSEVSVRSFECRYAFMPDRVDWSWVPYLRPLPDHIIGQHVLRSPAAMLQVDDAVAAIVPDVARYPADSKTYRMGLHFDRTASRPEFGFGFIPHQEEGLLYFRRLETGQKLAEGTALRFAYYLLAEADAPVRGGHQTVSRFLWERFGRDGHKAMREQVLPFKGYLDYTHRYVNEVLWTELGDLGEGPAGCIPMGIKYSNDVWFHFLFNHLFTAYGFYRLGERTGAADWKDKAVKIKNLILTSPQRNGLFAAIFSFDIITGNRRTEWINSASWLPGRITYGTYVDRPEEPDQYHLPDCSWTAYWMLRWHQTLEKDDRLLAFAARYADGLLTYQLPTGGFPTYVSAKTMRPEVRLLGTAGSAASGLFLAELHRVTGEERYLEAARRTADYLAREVMPISRWQDMEYANDSLGRPPELYDRFGAQFPLTTMPLFWAAELFRTLGEIGGSDEDMRRAISIVDYLCLYQAVWSPPFLSLAVFGGFVVGNGHPAWSDARQGFFAQALPYYYRLTGNPEYLERAVSAARAALPLAFIPENAPISPIWNVGPPGHSDENYGHRGQDGRAVDHSIDFGVGYSLAAYGMIAHEYGDLYVDLEGRVAVGIDGIAVQRAEFEPAAVRLEVKAVSADRRPVQVVVEGCSPGDGHTVTVNGKAQSFTPDAERTSFRMTLGG